MATLDFTKPRNEDLLPKNIKLTDEEKLEALSRGEDFQAMITEAKAFGEKIKELAKGYETTLKAQEKTIEEFFIDEINYVIEHKYTDYKGIPLGQLKKKHEEIYYIIVNDAIGFAETDKWDDFINNCDTVIEQKRVEIENSTQLQKYLKENIQKPEIHSTLNNKLFSLAFNTTQDSTKKPIESDKRFRFDIKKGTPQKKKPTAHIQLLDSVDGKIIDGRLTPFDRIVFDSAISFYMQNDSDTTIITPEAIYRELNNKKGGEVPDAEKKNIKEALEKMSFTKISISIPNGANYNGYALPLESITDYKDSNGDVYDIYSFIKKPVLLEYTEKEANKQIISVPEEYQSIYETALTDGKKVATNKRVKQSKNRMVIKDNLAKRIKRMEHDWFTDAPKRNDKKRHESNKILLETLFKEAGIEDIDKQKYRNYCKYVEKVLDYYEAISFISGWQSVVNSKGRTEAFIIKIDEPNS